MCSHPCALAAEVEKLSLLLWLHIVLQCMVPLSRAEVGALGLKTEQGEAKIWVKQGDVGVVSGINRNLQEWVFLLSSSTFFWF